MSRGAAGQCARWTAAALSAAVTLLGCRGDAPAPPGGVAAASATPRSPAAPAALAEPRAKIAASMITIAHADAHEHAGRQPRPARSEAEALALARALVAELRRDPGRFAEVARERSDDPLAPAGGDLGTWTAGDQPELDEAVSALAVGAISDPVPSEHGVRIFRRDAPVPDVRVAARQLVVAWSGATRAPAGLARTRAEAAARAEALAAAARQDPAGFEALIRRESDGYDRDRGGYLGAWMTNRGRYPPGFDRAVSALPEGGISEPFASDLGYHVLQRLAAPPAPVLLAGAHILISFAGAEKARPGVRRSEAEARAEAERVADEARRDPVRFGQIAAARSDDASGNRGGDLGSFRKGTLPAAVEEALERLRFGEVGGPVRTQYGYHVLIRREAPTDKEYVAP